MKRFHWALCGCILFFNWTTVIRAQAPAMGRAERQRASEEYFHSGRQSPDAHSAAAHLQRAYQQRQALRALQGAQSSRAASYRTTSGSVQWQNLGPAPQISGDYGYVSGRMTSIAVDPTDASGNTVYAGAAYGGLWKSANAAAANPSNVVWTPLFDTTVPTLAVGSIAVKPDDGRVILVGTGEPNNADDSYYGLGILRSTDGGATWNTISTADGGTKTITGAAIATIAFHPGNSNLVVAGAAYPARPLGAFDPASLGPLYSTDAGATWNSGRLTDDGVNYFIAPLQSVIYNLNNAKWFAAVQHRGFYSSSDGITWTPAASQPSTLLGNACGSTCPIYRGVLAVRADKNEMFAYFIDDDFNDMGVYRSGDGGNTWKNLGTSGFDNCGDEPGCGSEQGYYNMSLAAVPNGSTTDLYLGAVNLFKCPVDSATGACSGWLNLSHVWGCDPLSATSHLHFYQHGMDFVNTANHVTGIAYFANDGGIYRTLDSPSFNNGACTGPANPVENLNGTLGSISQVNGFSQHPADPNILLEGSQANGAAAITSSGAGTTWIAVQPDDDGATIVDRVDPVNWYVSSSYGDLSRCQTGPNCRGGFTPVTRIEQIGAVAVSFFPPFLLDPANSGTMLAGSCRVWRGDVNGAGWTTVSPNFTTGNNSGCAATNVIRSLAAGGPSAAGISQAVYAGTSRGELWVTRNGAAGTPAWTKTLGPIVAKNSYIPISSLTMDGPDASGQTAYATVMGFGVAHVLKTVNAGANWSDISANLPDAPADSLAIDPRDHNLVYVGTDVGVFMTNLSVQPISWVEWGGASLPNVPVTRLEVFDGAVPKLRASTYGRGVWQIDVPSVVSPGPVADTRHRSSNQPARKAAPQPLTDASTTLTEPLRKLPTPGDVAHRRNQVSRSIPRAAHVSAGGDGALTPQPAGAADTRHRPRRLRKLAPQATTS